MCIPIYSIYMCTPIHVHICIYLYMYMTKKLEVLYVYAYTKWQCVYINIPKYGVNTYIHVHCIHTRALFWVMKLGCVYLYHRT